MDDNRFDNLTRRLGGSLTRRRAIASALGLAAMASSVTHSGTDAARPCAGPGRNCTRSGDCCSRNCMRVPTSNNQSRLTCGCATADETLCDRACVDLDTDARNCGACRHRCGSGQTCVAGRCTSAPTGPTGPTGPSGPSGSSGFTGGSGPSGPVCSTTTCTLPTDCCKGYVCITGFCNI